MSKKDNNNRIKNRVAIYSRYSSNNQKEESIDIQNREAEKYCKDKGYIIIDRYYDPALSGRNDKRPEFQRMIADAKKGLFDVCVVLKLSRFSRRIQDAYKYKNILNDNGVRLESIYEKIDDSLSGLMLEALFFGMAEGYIKELAISTLDGQKENARKGMNTGGKPCLGLNVDKKTKLFSINEEEAVIIKKIFRMYDDGFSYRDIISSLNNCGYKTKNKKEFGKNSLHSILRNTKYAGIMTFNRCESKKSDGSRNYSASKPIEEMIIEEGLIPAIIPKDMFDRVQVRLNNIKGGGHNTKKTNYLLAGIITCVCGKSMTGNTYINSSRGTRHTAYRCENPDCQNGQIKAEIVDTFVLMELERIIFNENQIPFLLEKMRELQKEYKDDNVDLVKKINHQLKGIETKIENFFTAIENGLSNDENALKRYEMLKEEKQLLQKQLLSKETNQSRERVEIDEETIYRLFAQYKSFILNRNIPACRTFIKTYVNKVVVSNDDVEIELVVPSVYPENKQQWLKMRSAIAIKVLKEPFRTTKRLRLANNTVVPLDDLTILTAKEMLKKAQV